MTERLGMDRFDLAVFRAWLRFGETHRGVWLWFRGSRRATSLASFRQKDGFVRAISGAHQVSLATCDLLLATLKDYPVIL
jgi:hypothetical protein